MLSLRAQFVPLLILVGVSGISLRSRAQEAQTQEPPAAAQESDSIPLTPAEMPPGPIIVSYQNGQLMIEAQNATLSSVVRAACNQTGTAVDVPSNTDERVVGVYGPGPARDVFASLLNGSRFNYLMLGSAHDANVLMRLILTSKPGGQPDNRQVDPAAKLVAKAAEPALIHQLPLPQAKPQSADPKADQPAPELRRRKHRRRW